MTVWDPEVGEEVVIIGGTYREEARVRKVERLTNTQIVVEGEACRFRREFSSQREDGYPEFRGRGGSEWHALPTLLHPQSFRARRVLAENEERRSRIEMRHLAEELEKDPRRPGGILQLQEAIKRLERAVATMDAIYEERPEYRPRKDSYR